MASAEPAGIVLEDCSGQRHPNPVLFAVVPRGNLQAGMGTQHQPAILTSSLEEPWPKPNVMGNSWQ